jgi:hypothetical protein
MSNANKTTIMRTFNTNLFQFFDDIIGIFPDKREIQTTKIALETIKQSNPSLIIKVWKTNIYDPYREIIDGENIEYFFEKDYSSDLANTKHMNEILQSINNIRDPIKSMNPENKKHSMNYVKLLSQLSQVYDQL